MLLYRGSQRLCGWNLKIIEEKRNQQLGDCKKCLCGAGKSRSMFEAIGSQSVTVEDMAAEIHFSANYIRTIFKEGTACDIIWNISQITGLNKPVNY